jgi:hypothetical protein
MKGADAIRSVSIGFIMAMGFAIPTSGISLNVAAAVVYLTAAVGLVNELIDFVRAE